jgi:phosphatidylglycerol---prolipoprotein diacylglyceryl transferase
MSALLASIPSPHRGAVVVGPVTIHMYGLTLLAAIVACVFITGRRWVARGGDMDLIYRCAVWGVGSGIVGARLYHLATSWDQVPSPWWGPFAIWRGGLGVWGGIAAGVLVGTIVARRAGANVPLLMDCVAPGLLVAQGIGRLGNWWNQELYGKPTSLPWGLKIDPAHYPASAFYPPGTTFHPTFLYELLFDLAVAAFLLWLGRSNRIRPPGLFALYVTLYCFGRFWVEALRIDPAHHIAGLRVNDWVAAAGFFAGLVWFRRTQGTNWRPPRLRRRKSKPPPPPPAMAVPKGRVRSGR